MIKISIDTDNASFQDNGIKNELKKIFNSIIGKIERSDVFGLYDSNGNLIGNFKIE